MFDEMKAQVRIIPLLVIRLAVSQFARQSLSICCYHSTLGTDCASFPEIRACLSGDSWLTTEESAVCGCVCVEGGGRDLLPIFTRSRPALLCMLPETLSKGEVETLI